MKNHANPKPDKAVLAHLERVAHEAFPDWSVRFCSHGDLGGHRAPRVNTLAFRMVNAKGNYCSNVIWVMPQSLKGWTAEDVRKAVERSNGK